MSQGGEEAEEKAALRLSLRQPQKSQLVKLSCDLHPSGLNDFGEQNTRLSVSIDSEDS